MEEQLGEKIHTATKACVHKFIVINWTQEGSTMVKDVTSMIRLARSTFQFTAYWMWDLGQIIKHYFFYDYISLSVSWESKRNCLRICCDHEISCAESSIWHGLQTHHLYSRSTNDTFHFKKKTEALKWEKLVIGLEI